MIFTHYFINIYEATLNFCSEINFLEIKHMGLQFQDNNEKISIRISEIWFFEVGSSGCYKLLISFGHITTYPYVIRPKFKLSTCGLKFGTLPIWGLLC